MVEKAGDVADVAEMGNRLLEVTGKAVVHAIAAVETGATDCRYQMLAERGSERAVETAEMVVVVME